jgi:hypothetical protein
MMALPSRTLAAIYLALLAVPKEPLINPSFSRTQEKI